MTARRGRGQKSLSATSLRAGSLSCISLIPVMARAIQSDAIARCESESLSIGVFVNSSELALVFDALLESSLDVFIVTFRFQYFDVLETLQLNGVRAVSDINHVEK